LSNFHETIEIVILSSNTPKNTILKFFSVISKFHESEFAKMAKILGFKICDYKRYIAVFRGNHRGGNINATVWLKMSGEQ